ACVPRDDFCLPGASECTSETSYRTCSTNGTWSESTCSCSQSPIGAICAPAFATAPFTGTLTYDRRRPRTDLSDWGPVEQVPASGLLAVSYHDGEIVDAATVEEDGSFSVRMRTPATSLDSLRFLAVRPEMLGGRIAFAVGDPDLPAGTFDIDEVRSWSATYWSWRIQMPQESGRGWNIAESNWSAPVFLFQWAEAVWELSKVQQGRRGRPLIVWNADGVEWSCGACMWSSSFTLSSSRFDVQIFVSSTDEDRSYYGAPMMGHELGHWAMASFGTLPGEGGRHCLGVAALPGLAWAEGWATWYSSSIRGDPRYWDKQGGTFFWADLEARRILGFEPFLAPTAAGGLHQRMDELWLAAALWDISHSAAVPPNQLHAALASRRMNEPPFGRGYTKKLYDVDARCVPINVTDTGESAPIFPDFLDALRCDGVRADALSDPIAPYPYPTAQPPICPP
ncbi:MAG TPA: hypothetical protein VN033_12715, partial [Vulgatibacter sp.]|nr:hypothetical protein [Vulgatibacter sp.]